MTLRLVLAGTHQQFMTWLAEGGRSPAEFKPVRSEQDLLIVGVREVASFDQVGTYWTNQVWGSEEYKRFMAEGVSYDMHWASPWEADFTRCQAIQAAWRGVGAWTDTMAETRQRQHDMEELLGD